MLISGCKSPSDALPEVTASRQLTPAMEADIASFCSDCHAMPDPNSFPKSAWENEVRRGYDFYYESGKKGLSVPVFADTQHYFVSRAPEKLTLAASDKVNAEWLNRFQQTPIFIPELSNCAVSFIDVVDLGAPLGRGILFSEMSQGGIYFCTLNETGTAGAAKLLAKAGNPAVVRVCDWDMDGLRDMMVADLGSFLPEDHQRGRVLWLRQSADTPGEFSVQSLQGSIGRVSAVEVADFNSDGQLDLLAAEFGWQSTGSIFWLQRAADGDPLHGLTKHEIDARSGTIHVPLIDINKDGNMDFVALISQHHERVEAMINDGHGAFHSELIFAAPEPAYGSSGIDLVDMNGDGNVDVLYSNGDSFDSFILKPSHGLRWFENKGTFPFETHEIGKLPGAHRGLVGDFDGTGIHSIVGSAFFAKDVFRAQGLERTEGLVIWQANDAASYTKYVLSHGDCTHAAVRVIDLDGNGRDDLIVGEFGNKSTSQSPAITLWMSR
jgi:FG-GAP-like repeat